MTIAFVGEILNQPETGTWFLMVRNDFKHLFPTLPDITRFLTIICTCGHGRHYRILRNLESIWADFALCLANTIADETTYSMDSKPIPVCKMKRYKFPRAMTEASKGYSTIGGVFGFKLHGL